MPKALHDKLARAARKKGLKGKDAGAYIYGTMAEIEKSGGVKKQQSNRKKGVARP
jgi:hypothetical protein